MFKIAKIDTFGVGLPLKAPIKMSSVVIDIAENIIVRIEDTDVERRGDAEDHRHLRRQCAH